jgi:hypothetical protein
MALYHNLPTDFDFWEKFNRAMLEPAGSFAVLCIDGIGSSKGVMGEYRMACGLSKPLFFIDPEDLKFIPIVEVYERFNFNPLFD